MPKIKEEPQVLVYRMSRRMFDVLKNGLGKQNEGYGTDEAVLEFVQASVNRNITKIELI